jgi:hypothetical protein
VDDRVAETGEAGRRDVGVDRVVVTRDGREGAQVARRDKTRRAARDARGVADVVAQRSTGPGRVDQLAGTGTATDREALPQGREVALPTVGPERGDRDVDRDDATEVGVLHLVEDR